MASNHISSQLRYIICSLEASQKTKEDMISCFLISFSQIASIWAFPSVAFTVYFHLMDSSLSFPFYSANFYSLYLLGFFFHNFESSVLYVPLFIATALNCGQCSCILCLEPIYFVDGIWLESVYCSWCRSITHFVILKNQIFFNLTWWTL